MLAGFGLGLLGVGLLTIALSVYLHFVYKIDRCPHCHEVLPNYVPNEEKSARSVTFLLRFQQCPFCRKNIDKG